MAISYSTAVKNARLDAVETTAGTAPLLRVYNGSVPISADAALSGNTLLAQGTLPTDWLANAASGVKAKAGVWALTGQAGAASGTAGTFFRIYDSAGSVCHIQGTFGATATDLTVDNNSIANAQTVNVNSFTITAGN